MPNVLKIHPAARLRGECVVSGDKSITHRAVLLGILADGTSRIRNYLDGDDCRATIDVAQALGARVEQVSPRELHVQGRGLRGLIEPAQVLNCRNSGTTMRLLLGLLSPQRFTAFLDGTEQLRSRPMARIVKPLRDMGAAIMGRDNGSRAPLGVEGRPLRGIRYPMPVPSAQVKSGILLAGLYADGPSCVLEPGPSRDHTERMLSAMGVDIRCEPGQVTLQPPQNFAALDIDVPGDPSSAAFIVAAVAITQGSEVLIRNVGMNPTRAGFFRAVSMMAGHVEELDLRVQGGEPVADLFVQSRELRASQFDGEGMVTMIDELPVLAVVATQATGTTVIRGAAELRVKETDRIETTIEELRKLGAKLEPLPDGLVIEGPVRLEGAKVSSHGDHRIAMALAVAALAAEGVTEISDAHVTGDSFPGFEEVLRNLGATVEVLA